MRVGTVIEAEKVKGSDKLIKLKVDLGESVKQAIAGMAHLYEAEDLLGKQYVFVVNLRPARIRGEISECMILAAAEDDHLVVPIVPESKVSNGMKVL